MPAHLEKRHKSSWTIVIDLGRDQNGKRKRITKNIKGTKKEAEREMARLLHEIEQGAYVKPTKMKVGEFLEKWIKTYGATKLSPTTQESYEIVIHSHLIPNLGHIELCKLQPLDLQNYYSKALQEGRRDGKGGLSPRSVQYHHTILHEALNHAVKWQLLARNPADAVEPPKNKRKEMQTLDIDGVNKLLDHIKDKPEYPVIFAAIYTGMRRGELLGLRWQDVDLKARVIRIQQTLQRTPALGYYFGEPKTPKSRRQILIPATLVDLLKSLQKEQIRNKLALGPEYKDHNLVFCKKDGSPLSPYDLSHNFAKYASEAGFPDLRFHDLRHTHATLLLASGIHPKVVQERLGHENISTTMDIYSHVLPGLQEEAVNKLEATIGQRSGTGQRLGNGLSK